MNLLTHYFTLWGIALQKPQTQFASLLTEWYQG